MAYEKMRLSGVHNHYGARDSGGTAGINPDASSFSLNLDGPNLDLQFPMSKECGILVTGVVTAQATGVLTSLKVGGVEVKDATDADPVKIPKGNTGVVTQAGLTGGTVLFKYMRYMG
jgi:hypothetical protein